MPVSLKLFNATFDFSQNASLPSPSPGVGEVRTLWPQCASLSKPPALQLTFHLSCWIRTGELVGQMPLAGLGVALHYSPRKEPTPVSSRYPQMHGFLRVEAGNPDFFFHLHQ